MATAEPKSPESEVRKITSMDQAAIFRILRPKYSNLVILKAIRTVTSERAAAAASVSSKIEQEEPSVGALRKALARGEAVASMKVRGLNPLMYACSLYDDVLIHELLARDDLPREWLVSSGDYGYAPLHYCAESGASAVIQTLVRRIWASSPHDQVLVEADSTRFARVTTALLAPTTDQHLQKAVVQSGGMTPLHLAAAKGYFECVQVFLQAADPSFYSPVDDSAASVGSSSHGMPPPHAPAAPALAASTVLIAGTRPKESVSDTELSTRTTTTATASSTAANTMANTMANMVDLDGNTPLVLACMRWLQVSLKSSSSSSSSGHATTAATSERLTNLYPTETTPEEEKNQEGMQKNFPTATATASASSSTDLCPASTNHVSFPSTIAALLPWTTIPPCWTLTGDQGSEEEAALSSSKATATTATTAVDATVDAASGGKRGRRGGSFSSTSPFASTSSVPSSASSSSTLPSSSPPSSSCLGASSLSSTRTSSLLPPPRSSLPPRSWLRAKQVSDALKARQRVESAWMVDTHLAPVKSFPSLFSVSECSWLQQEATAAAARRGGWHGDRHRGYATTDLRVSHVSQEVDEWVRTAIAERLYPILRKHFSPPVITTVAATKEAEEAKVPAAAAAAAIPASGSPDAEVEVCAYSFRDIFFVKYEAVEGGQRSVGLHRDGSSLSFNILLNHPSEFEGGGTYFDHPLNYTRQIEQGSVLVHSGRRRHAGVEITAGIRFLLVGFIDEHRSTTDSKHLELHFQDHS